MGLNIGDPGDPSRTLRAHWWQWRPLMLVIGSAGLFDEGRLLEAADGRGEFTSAEARRIAKYLERAVLPKLGHDGRILRYSLDRKWLAGFIEFCKTSRGLHIGSVEAS